MSFPDELSAFRAFAASSPKNCTLLIDTYDVREGVEHAIVVAKEMEARGESLAAIRIDSGDLARLSKYVRSRFDEEGLGYVKVSVSNDLDEYTIQSLLDQGAPIDSFGVGTKLATCYDQPALGGVYKLSARRGSAGEPWTPVVKLSEQPYKRTIPGIQQVRRYMDACGAPVCDMIVDESAPFEPGDSLVAVGDAALVVDVSGLSYRELLEPCARDGRACAPREPLEAARARCAAALDALDPAYKRFLYPQSYVVGMEARLARVRDDLVRERMAEPSRLAALEGAARLARPPGAAAHPDRPPAAHRAPLDPTRPHARSLARAAGALRYHVAMQSENRGATGARERGGAHVQQQQRRNQDHGRQDRLLHPGGEDRALRRDFIAGLARQALELRELGWNLVVVSSGAIAAGAPKLGFPSRPHDMPSLQACASVGQCILSAVYDEEFRAAGLLTSLVLLTRHDTARRSSYLHARDALTRLVELGVVPVVNENDTTTVDEIKFGDNDTLAALVSCLVSADLCVTLSDIDGLYTANPSIDPSARFIPRVDKIDAAIIGAAGDSTTAVGTGGMITKIRASRILMTAGISSVICSGAEPDPLVRLARGESVGTLFEPAAGQPEIAPRKLWIALGDSARGSVTVDDGAAAAVRERGSSLLPVGITAVEGSFGPATCSTCATRAASSSPAASPRPARTSSSSPAAAGRRRSPATACCPPSRASPRCTATTWSSSRRRGSPARGPRPGARFSARAAARPRIRSPRLGTMDWHRFDPYRFQTRREPSWPRIPGRTWSSWRTPPRRRRAPSPSRATRPAATPSARWRASSPPAPTRCSPPTSSTCAPRPTGTSEGLLDRLLLTPERIEAMASALSALADLPDPVGRVLEHRTIDCGLDLQKVSVPLGLVAMVYEARPNVTADAAGICIRTGNACILRGGSMAQRSCAAIAHVLADAVESCGFPRELVSIIETTDREATGALMSLHGVVDVLIPRGGAGLIQRCVRESLVPVIETGTGNCHVYVHASADFERARAIVMNAKTQRVGVCNACESLLVDESIADDFLPRCSPSSAPRASSSMVTRPCATSPSPPSSPTRSRRTRGREYLALEISVKCVSGIDEAISHINAYGTGHSEAIVAEDAEALRALPSRGRRERGLRQREHPLHRRRRVRPGRRDRHLHAEAARPRPLRGRRADHLQVRGPRRGPGPPVSGPATRGGGRLAA